MREYKIRRYLSQHFLVDKNIINKIISASGVKKEDYVLEIGAGGGNLTFALAKIGCKIVAIEIDENLVNELNRNNTYSNLKIIHGDFLKLDLDKILIRNKKYKVVANIPYHITSPILEKLLTYNSKFEYFIIMLQKELAKRICAKVGEKDYSAFTIFVQFYTEPKILFYVKSSCFYPPPDVTSAVVKLVNKEEPKVDKELFFKIVRGVFTHRRKKILNALCYVFPKMGKILIEDILKKVGIGINNRPEVIPTDKFVELTNYIVKLPIQTK